MHISEIAIQVTPRPQQTKDFLLLFCSQKRSACFRSQVLGVTESRHCARNDGLVLRADGDVGARGGFEGFEFAFAWDAGCRLGFAEAGDPALPVGPPGTGDFGGTG
jgi:hypothetical protein